MTEHPANEPNVPAPDADATAGLLDLADLPDEILELVSAYLDGEATAEECRLVEADPQLMLHVKHLGGLTAALRTFHATDLDTADDADPLYDADTRTRHLATALEAWGEHDPAGEDSTRDPAGGTDDAGGAPPASVVPLPIGPAGPATSPRGRQRSRGPAARTLAGIAAAAVVLFGTAGVLAQLGGQQSDETASSATEARDSAGGATQEALSSAAAVRGDVGVPSLGSFASPDLVLDAAAAVGAETAADPRTPPDKGSLPGAGAVTTTAAANATSSPTETTKAASKATEPMFGQQPMPESTPAATGSCGGNVVAAADVGGLAVVVIDEGSTRRVVDRLTCQVLAERPLPR